MSAGTWPRHVMRRTDKLSPGDVREIRRLRSELGLFYAELGAQFGVTKERARQVCNGLTHFDRDFRGNGRRKRPGRSAA